jgi:predicted transcriptional regulator
MDTEEVHVVTHPVRWKILQLLTKKPMYINEISSALGEDRRLVSYHLLTLEDYGFVKSKYEVSENRKSKGKALRMYWMTDKVLTAIEMMHKLSLE